MQRREFLAHAVVAMGTAAILPAFAQTPQQLESIMPKAKSGFAPVNGLQIYYEVNGCQFLSELARLKTGRLGR